MPRVNPDFVEAYVALERSSVTGLGEDYYALKLAPEGFVLGSSIDRAFFPISKDPKVHVIALGVNNILVTSIEDPSKYRLTFKGLVIPEERSEFLQELELGLSEVYRSNFKATPVSKGESFAVRTKASWGRKEERVDYVISPKHPKLNEILEALQAPADLILSQN